MEAFHDKTYSDESIVKSKSSWEPKVKDKYLIEMISKIEHTDPQRLQYKDNLSPAERNALTELKGYDDIIVKKADKGNTLVIMDRTFYKNKLVLQDHLLQETYKKVS